MGCQLSNPPAFYLVAISLSLFCQVPQTRAISSGSAISENLFSPFNQGQTFASARHFYTTLSTSSKLNSELLPRRADFLISRPAESGRLELLEKRLAELRHQLELDAWSLNTPDGVVDGTTGKRRTWELGDACLSSQHCSQRYKLHNSHCNLDSYTCTCLPQHVQFNSTACLPAALLGFECLNDAQCQLKVANSECRRNICTCPEDKFVAHRIDKCLSASKLDDYCLSKRQCQLNDRNSDCKWKIPNVYGVCKCAQNYAQIEVPTLDSHSNESTNFGTLNMAKKCLPRLGDSCQDSSECELATPNSECRPFKLENLSSNLNPKGEQGDGQRQQHLNHWPREPQSHATFPSNSPFNSTTFKSDSLLKCLCKANFKQSRNKMSCELDLTGEGTDNKQSTVLPSAEISSALIVSTASPSTLTYASTSSSTTTTTTMATSSGFVSPSQGADSKHQYEFVDHPHEERRKQQRISSLGQTCIDSLECQARDINSRCFEGRCECIQPTSGCSANSTGCPPDTFQCRSGHCISWYFVCDNYANCPDGSDELGCNLTPGTLDHLKLATCPTLTFACSDGKGCINRSKLCNGKRDCTDNSDESGCFLSSQQQDFSSRQTCPLNTFQCNDGQCLPAYVFCNSVPDCRDASDENLEICEHNATRLTVTANSTFQEHPNNQKQQQQHRPQQQALVQPLASNSPIVKLDRVALERLLSKYNLLLPSKRTPEARGKRRVQDFVVRGSQHQARRKSKVALGPRRREARLLEEWTELSNEQRIEEDKLRAECPNWAFSCRNGRCRSSATLCSGIDGCGDNSDEQHCEVCRCQAPT